MRIFITSRLSLILAALLSVNAAASPWVIILDAGGVSSDRLFGDAAGCVACQPLFPVSTSLLQVNNDLGAGRDADAARTAVSTLLGTGTSHLLAASNAQKMLVASASFTDLSEGGRVCALNQSHTGWAVLRRKYGQPVDVTDDALAALKSVRRQLGEAFQRHERAAGEAFCFDRVQSPDDALLLNETLGQIGGDAELIITVLQGYASAEWSGKTEKEIFQKKMSRVADVFNKVKEASTDRTGGVIYLALGGRPADGQAGLSGPGCAVCWGGPFSRGLVCTATVSLRELLQLARFAVGRGEAPTRDSLLDALVRRERQ